MHAKLMEIIGINKVNMQTPVSCSERYFNQYISRNEEFILLLLPEISDSRT